MANTALHDAVPRSLSRRRRAARLRRDRGGAVTPRVLADAAGGVSIGMRAYTAIFPGGTGVYFDSRLLPRSAPCDDAASVWRRIDASGDAQAADRRRRAALPVCRHRQFLDSRSRGLRQSQRRPWTGHGARQGPLHQRSSRRFRAKLVFGAAGDPASAIRVGDRCLTVLYPYDPADRFDHEYYRDQHMPSLVEMFGREAITRVEVRKGLSSPNGRDAAALQLHCKHLRRRCASLRRGREQESTARRRRCP